MDGASSLRTLRWKQICAGALSAASLLAGHLVFGQDTQPIRRPGNPAAGQSARGSEPLAPILNARAMPAPAARRTAASKPTGDGLPPILQGKQLPKPHPSEATFVPLQPRQEQPAASAPPAKTAEPVATLELAPNRIATPVEKPSEVSPWMMDINQALAQSGEKKSHDKAASNVFAGIKNEATKSATTKDTPPPIVAGANSAATTDTDKQKAIPLPQPEPPTVQLGPPMPSRTFEKPATPQLPVVTGRSPADLRRPTTVTPPAAQLNPFAPQSSSFPPKSDRVAAKPQQASKYGERQLTSIEAEPRQEVTKAIAPQADVAVTAMQNSAVDESVGNTPTTSPASPEANTADVEVASKIEAQAPKTWLPPVVGAGDSTVSPKPKQSQAPAADAPIVERSALIPRPKPTIQTPRAEAKAAHHAVKGDHLRLTGYEPEENGALSGEGPVFPSDSSVTAEPQSHSDLRSTELHPTPSLPEQRQFIQVQAPRQLPGMPAGPFEMIGESGTVSVMVRRSMLLRTANPIYRTAVVDPAICDVIQFTPKEISIIGKSQGSTHVTFWFEGDNSQPITYLVKVEPDSAEVKKEEDKYKLLEDVVNEMFPDSKVQLMLVADKLIVKGQAKDSEEATQIMSIIRTNAGSGAGGAWGPGGWNGGAGGGLSEGVAADVLSDSATGSAARARYQVINMLRVPGVQQVALRVKIAELNRTAARGFGVDVQGNVAFSDSPEGTDLFFNSILNVAGGGAPALLAQFDGDDISIGIRYLQQQGVIRLLSEPTLVTMSGRPATFVAGGEFAVPTVVGSAGLNAVTTDFRAFGAIISFLPTVVDKDRIRLEVSPEFSQINQDIAVGGTPGLKTRAVTTTVEMREGQTFAIAGLLEDNMNGTTIGDLPFLAQIFGRRSMQRAETELIILVTPELVHPMEAEEVPPLPGFDVTEPDNAQFFLHGKIEGTPTREYRSTVWPRLKNRYKAGGPAMTSGPFGHGQ